MISNLWFTVIGTIGLLLAGGGLGIIGQKWWHKRKVKQLPAQTNTTAQTTMPCFERPFHWKNLDGEILGHTPDLPSDEIVFVSLRTGKVQMITSDGLNPISVAGILRLALEEVDGRIKDQIKAIT